MNIIELKNQINNNTLDDSFLILKYTDTDFNINEYINKIAENKSLETRLVNSLKDISQDSFGDLDNYLNILRLDKFDENAEFDKLDNTIVVCKTIDKVLAKKAEPYVIEFPKLEKWQVIAYMQMICPGLDENILDWLYTVTKGDVYRITNELNKIKLFNEKDRPKVFNDLNTENNYNDLTVETIFNYLTALTKKDCTTVHKILLEGSAVDLEGTGLVTLLIRNLKNMIQVQMTPNATAQSLGMNPKVFNAIKYNKKFTDVELINLFEFVTSIDYKLKSGNLPFDPNSRQLLDFVTNRVLS